ncbi:MAG TPA: MFS transporter [Gemmatimonadales bacterium]|nr:MFS transporter [Gemmatimonadales bacterium]
MPKRPPTPSGPEGGGGEPGPGAYAAYALGLLTLINVLNYTDRNVVFALFEPIKRDLGLSDQELGWLGSAYVIVLSLAALPLGVLGDLKSRRAVIAFGVALWSTFTALGGVVRSFWQLFFCRAMVGVGEAGYGPAAQAIIAEFYRGHRRAFAIGIYSVGMAFGGVLGVWLGGVLSERFGWRATFVIMGVPGFLLAALASQLREPAQRAPAGVWITLKGWVARSARRTVQVAAPLIWLSAAGAALGGLLALFEGAPSQVDAAVFGAFVTIGIVWTVFRLVPIAIQRTTEATEVAATAFEDFLAAAATVLRTPTLIWVFLGGAMVTFAMNGLIAWAPSFMHRIHGMSVSEVGRQFGLWALLGGALGALTGGRLGDFLMKRWPGGRVIAAGLGFVLGGPICAALLMVEEVRAFVPLFLLTFFFYTWYNGPLAAVILDVVPAAVRASVLGAYVLFSHLAGDAIAPPLVGYLSDQLTAALGQAEALKTAMLVLPSVGVVGGLVILIALRTVARDMRRVR